MLTQPTTEKLIAMRLRGMDVCTYQSLKAILDNNLDGQALEPARDPHLPIEHPHLRGPDSYDSDDSPTPERGKKEDSC